MTRRIPERRLRVRSRLVATVLSFGLVMSPLSVYAAPEEPTRSTSADLSGRQYMANSEYGINDVSWNTYDTEGHPTPRVNSEGTVVAVFDCGVDYEHEDLKNVMWDEGLNHQSLKDMGGGKYGICVSPVNSMGDPYDSTDPMDDEREGHGTHVAGIIAAEWNKIGVSGITSGTKIMAVKVSNDRGITSTAELIQGYRYVIEARKAGVNVVAVNVSLGFQCDGNALNEIITEAGKLGIVTCVAASNSMRDLDPENGFAAALADNPYVLVVGASDAEGKPWADESGSGSNYGRRTVDVFAPGADIISTFPERLGELDTTSDIVEEEGKLYFFDYTQDEYDVTDGKDSSVFGYTGEETLLSKGTEGLILSTPDGGESGMFTLAAPVLENLETCKGGVITVKAPVGTELSLTFDCDDRNYGSVERVAAGDGMAELPFVLPGDDDPDLSKAMLVISAYPPAGSEDEETVPEIKEITVQKSVFFTAKTKYHTESGTSMATPVMAGVAAMLSSTFNRDTADKIVARMQGSVQRVDSLKDKCIAEGIFSLDRALDEKTFPVINGLTRQGDQAVITGYFFGSLQPTVKIDGKEVTSVSGDSTTLTVTIPEGVKDGEVLVEVTSEKGTGHRLMQLGTAEELYPRLSLPDESEEGFYAADIMSMTAIGDSLYVVLGAGDTRIYSYNTLTKTWKKEYQGEYPATEGACEVNGKLLFLTSDVIKGQDHIGCFDPASGNVTYKLYQEDFFITHAALVNAGTGVYIVGGREGVYGNIKNQGTSRNIIYINTSDLTDIKTETIEDARVNAENPIIVSDGQGTIYIYGSHGGDSEISFTTPITIKASGNTAKVSGGTVKDIYPKTNRNQMAVGSAAATAAGNIMMTGPVVTDDTGKVIEDTYVVGPGKKNIQSTGKIVSLTPVYHPASAVLGDTYYVLGTTDSEACHFVFAAAPAAVPSEDEELPVYKLTADEPETVTVRTFNEHPDVVYMDITVFLDRFYGRKLSVEKTNSTYILSEEKVGERAVIDTDKDTLTTGNYHGLIQPLIEGREGDSLRFVERAAFLQHTEDTATKQEKDTVLDFGAYGIDLIEADGRIYAPLSILGALFNTGEDPYVITNGEAVYVNGTSMDPMDEDQSENDDHRLDGLAEGDRPQELIRESYAELCFELDLLYSLEGTHCDFIQSLHKIGLDKTLDAFDPTLKTMLLSENSADYALGLERLLGFWLSDSGHTQYDRMQFMSQDELYGEIEEKQVDALELPDSFNYWYKVREKDGLKDSRRFARASGEMFDVNYYAVKGDTAYVKIDDFEVDYDRWVKYYQKKGDMPDDTFARVHIALEKANANKKIENFVIDITSNGGGDTEALLGVIGLITGKPQQKIASTVTGQTYVSNPKVDRNLDGRFDTKDDAVDYSRLNMAVLCSGYSFSCANTFTSAMRDVGIAVMGTGSGGGDSCVTDLATQEGITFRISGQPITLNAKGETIDEGIKADIDLRVKTGEDTYDYSAFYDDEKVSDALFRFYGKEKKKYSNEWVNGLWYNKNGKQSYKPVGSWHENKKGKWYSDTSGWYAKNQWQKIDGKWYYFNREGYMEKDAYRGGYYLMKNGAWDGKTKAAGWKQDKTGWWFKTGGKTWLSNCWKLIDGKWYYFKKTGYAAKSEFVQGWWVGSDCVQSDPAKYSWHKTGKGWWYGVSGGWYAKNAAYIIDGKKYNFDKNGYCTNP